MSFPREMNQNTSKSPKVIGYKMPHVVPKWLVWKMKMDRKGTRNTYLSGNILHYKVFKIIFN